MDIQSLSMNMNQARVQEQATVQVQAMILNLMKEQSVALDKLLSSVQFITDPNLGQNINLIAQNTANTTVFHYSELFKP